jgi:hypothetical protein
MKSAKEASAIKAKRGKSSYNPQSRATIKIEELRKKRLSRYDNDSPASEKINFLFIIIIIL